MGEKGSKPKQFKDPIYGYVDVERKYIPAINSAEFQRLRNIRQTGYASLYPSALHNRFVHSLGVFHLGKKAISSLEANIADQITGTFKVSKDDWNKMKDTFVWACLLHDVGHSPFSHTGEIFYEQSTVFEDEFDNLIRSRHLNIDIITQRYGKPHEAMSAIIGINLLDTLGIKYDKEFFSRAIMGITYSLSEPDDKGSDNDREIYKKYTEDMKLSFQLKNCLISMLNGKLIDVDKLDYLMRDAYVTGYSSMMIDYERLISGYTIVSSTSVSGSMEYKIGFKKGSLSIIENIIYANDLEKRWIQGNPTILYDCKLIEKAIEGYDSYMVPKIEITQGKEKLPGSIFNKQSISHEGISLKSGDRLRLLCDDDIIVYIKNIDNTKISEHYFSRDKRYKPLWKSEGDYNQKVKKCISEKKLDEFRGFLKAKEQKLFFINRESLNNSQNNKEKEFLEFFKKFYDTNELRDYDFAIIRAPAFKSNRELLENRSIHISLGDGESATFDELLYNDKKSVYLRAREEDFFYVYTTDTNIQEMRDRGKDIAIVLSEYINQHWDIKLS